MNYEDIKFQIKSEILQIKAKSWKLKENIVRRCYPELPISLNEDKNSRWHSICEWNLTNSTSPIWFYSSDYSDILALNDLTNFVGEFVPFFETLSNAMMEIRTKSSNIKPLFDLLFQK